MAKSFLEKAGVPGTRHFAITKSDSAVVSPVPTSVYVGTGGDITVVDYNDVSCLYKNFPDGSFLPIVPKKIMSTGTSASDFVGVNR